MTLRRPKTRPMSNRPAGFGCGSLAFLLAKKRIEQTVGRILRKTQEERIQEPLIIDPVDQLSCFQALARRRMQYYKDQEYQIFKRHFRANRYYTLNPEQYIQMEPMEPLEPMEQTSH